jgi:hypothetical protein
MKTIVATRGGILLIFIVKTFYISLIMSAAILLVKVIYIVAGNMKTVINKKYGCHMQPYSILHDFIKFDI